MAQWQSTGLACKAWGLLLGTVKDAMGGCPWFTPSFPGLCWASALLLRERQPHLVLMHQTVKREMLGGKDGPCQTSSQEQGIGKGSVRDLSPQSSPLTTWEASGAGVGEACLEDGGQLCATSPLGKTLTGTTAALPVISSGDLGGLWDQVGAVHGYGEEELASGQLGPVPWGLLQGRSGTWAAEKGATRDPQEERCIPRSRAKGTLWGLQSPWCPQPTMFHNPKGSF